MALTALDAEFETREREVPGVAGGDASFHSRLRIVIELGHEYATMDVVAIIIKVSR